ncbi:LiaF transmembrane domain-containing protein [Pedobacter sp. GR22-6]|uniref:LiaF transmembrane domain-containing protein n=1 Tax=Pedobacter sp. GR22-6 TaxID=3127957 RepID=UPI00307F1DC7
MKLDRIMWGIVLLFIGGVLLLENFQIIDFHWGSVWRFWPIFLIIAGVNILFSKNKSQVGGIVSLAILVVTLILLFFKGQQPSNKSYTIIDRVEDEVNIDRSKYEDLHFSHPYTDSSSVKTVLNISGGGTSFELKEPTDSLIEAKVENRAGKFTLQTMKEDSVTTVNFKMNGKQKWNMGDGGNDVDFLLNKDPKWEVNMNMGAGEVKFDFSDYKVSKFNFDGGAAALDIRFGSLLPLMEVNVKTGVADVKINVPEASGCRIKTKTGLSSKDFSGFTKLDDGVYESPNYKSAVNKVLINLDGGLSNFEVHRY